MLAMDTRRQVQGRVDVYVQHSIMLSITKSKVDVDCPYSIRACLIDSVGISCTQLRFTSMYTVVRAHDVLVIPRANSGAGETSELVKRRRMHK